MTKEELFKKYNIDESHASWVGVDDWMSVELYRVMHDGNLPPPDDLSVDWILDFLDKLKSDPKFMNEMRKRKDFGSLYLTSKRMVSSLHENILEEINNK